ncbi:MAG: hypothetical protein ACPIOQ_18905 [Promethearchaeia archaeon]
MVFSERSGVPIDPRMLNVEGVFWRIEGKTEETKLRVNTNQPAFQLEGLNIRNGWVLDGKEKTEALEFRVTFKMAGQQRELELRTSHRVVRKCHRPALPPYPLLRAHTHTYTTTHRLSKAGCRRQSK